MPVDIHGKSYFTVAERLTQLHGDYKKNDPLKVETEIIKLDQDRDKETKKQIGSVVMKATITIGIKEGKRVFVGHALENFDANFINETSALENCETSAIGRALAAAGYIGSEYCSAEELTNAKMNQEPRKASKKQKEYLHDLTKKMNDEDAKYIILQAQNETTFDEFYALIKEANNFVS